MSMVCGFIPSPTDSEPCGSKSTSSTLRPYSASEAPRLIVVVVLPTPPFWLHIAMIRALPWMPIGRGSGRSGQGRPVGPSTTSSAEAAGATGATGAGAGSATGAWGTAWATGGVEGVEGADGVGTLTIGGMVGALDPEE